MNKQIDTGGPAFPCPSHHEDPAGSWPKGFGGMSLRDWFAGQVLGQVLDAAQTLQIKLSREYRLGLRKIRIKGENTRKELKEASLRTGKAIDAFNTILLHTLIDEETRLEEGEKIVERAEAARKAALKSSREEALKPFAIDTSFMSLADMPDATFAQLLENTRAGHEAKQAAAAKAEADRIEAENARLKEQARIREENARLQREAKEREEQRRIDMDIATKEKARVEDLARREREAAAATLAEERRLSEERDRSAKLIADLNAARLIEAERISAERAAMAKKAHEEVLLIQAAKLEEFERKADAARKASEAKVKTERAAREKLEAEIAEKVAQEVKQKVYAEQERKKAEAAPDKDRLISFANQVRALEVPAFQSDAAKALSTVIASQIAKLATWLEEKSNAL